MIESFFHPKHEDATMRYTHLLLVAGMLGAAACSDEGEGTRTAETAAPKSLLELEQRQAEAALVPDEPGYDFGEISIDGGDVTTAFKLTNEVDEAVELAAVYTSCGCTSAVLEFADGSSAGPFGMPGHGPMPEIERRIEPGERFDVRVTFDPAAHGPQGVGHIMRAVNIHTRDGGTTELRITADVVPATG